jgi:DNA-nicking Smr family endonuclease
MARSVPDAHLFELAMRDVVPLKRRKKQPVRAEPKPPEPAAREAAARRATYVPLVPSVPAAPRATARSPARKAAEPGLDRNTARRFERGEMPIDSAIDLHGMTQARAHEALDGFVAGAVRAGARMLLVVTGKGRQGEGVLRRHVPEWLRAGPHSGRILRIASARIQHGGEGAFYILLRRAR